MSSCFSLPGVPVVFREHPPSILRAYIQQGRCCGHNIPPYCNWSLNKKWTEARQALRSLALWVLRHTALEAVKVSLSRGKGYLLVNSCRAAHKDYPKPGPSHCPEKIYDHEAGFPSRTTIADRLRCLLWSKGLLHLEASRLMRSGLLS